MATDNCRSTLIALTAPAVICGRLVSSCLPVAHPMRLVNAIVPHDDLLPAVRDLASHIIRHSPLAIGSILTAVTQGLNASIDEGLRIESGQFAALVPTHDLGEGIAAWIARRQP